MYIDDNVHFKKTRNEIIASITIEKNKKTRCHKPMI